MNSLIQYDLIINVKSTDKSTLYISTRAGALYQISPSRRLIEYIYQLHNGAVNSIFINEGMCATGSDDGFIRVWPLDFSDFFLEAEHESKLCSEKSLNVSIIGPIVSVAISSDGLSLAVGTQNGSIGIMDLSSQKYRTIVRSHTSDVWDIAVDPHRSEFSTVSFIMLPVPPMK